MRGKHYMTFSERFKNRDESLYEKAFDYVWDKSAELLKSGINLTIDGVEALSVAVDRHDARVAELKREGKYKPIFSNLPVYDEDSRKNNKPTYNDLAIPGNPEFNLEQVPQLLQRYDAGDDVVHERIEELASKCDYERENFYNERMDDMKW